MRLAGYLRYLSTYVCLAQDKFLALVLALGEQVSSLHPLSPSRSLSSKAMRADGLEFSLLFRLLALLCFAMYVGMQVHFCYCWSGRWGWGEGDKGKERGERCVDG